MQLHELPVWNNPKASVDHCLEVASKREADAVRAEGRSHPAAPHIRAMAESWMARAEAISAHYGV